MFPVDLADLYQIFLIIKQIIRPFRNATLSQIHTSD